MITIKEIKTSQETMQDTEDIEDDNINNKSMSRTDTRGIGMETIMVPVTANDSLITNTPPMMISGNNVAEISIGNSNRKNVNQSYIDNTSNRSNSKMKDNENLQKQQKIQLEKTKKEIKNKIKIGCINIREMNDINKQMKLKRFIEIEKWDIAIMTETKLPKRKGIHIF